MKVEKWMNRGKGRNHIGSRKHEIREGGNTEVHVIQKMKHGKGTFVGS